MNWISVTDRLPEWTGQQVLVYVPWTHGDYGDMEVVYYHDCDWQHFDRKEKITHWMPLPLPPEQRR